MISWLIRLYPHHWRARYGEEFRDLLELEGLRPAVVLDVVLHALRARLDLRRHRVRIVVATTSLGIAEWYACTHGYPNALWLPRGFRSALLLGFVLAALATILVTLTRMIMDRTGRRTLST
jgi:hypothetical protein